MPADLPRNELANLNYDHKDNEADPHHKELFTFIYKNIYLCIISLMRKSKWPSALILSDIMEKILKLKSSYNIKPNIRSTFFIIIISTPSHCYFPGALPRIFKYISLH